MISIFLNLYLSPSTLGMYCHRISTDKKIEIKTSQIKLTLFLWTLCQMWRLFSYKNFLALAIQIASAILFA